MGEMIVNIKNTTTVQPSEESSKGSLWVSNLDMVVPRKYVQSIYFYKSNGSSDFFDPNLVKEALSRTLTLYYPMAGRLRMEADGGRIEIDCNDKGVSFAEAETTSILDDFGDFAPTVEYKKLVPSIDCSSEISSRPLLFLQLTYFKCGGISIGVLIHHVLADGFSNVHLINSWANMARGLDLAICRPFVDRSLLRARDPPSPKFHHVEYEPSPALLTPRPASSVVTLSQRDFIITRDQMNGLKANSKGANDVNYSSFEILAGHIWRCVCKARGLPENQPSKLYIPVDGRSRLKPNLPPMYFGNAVFTATPVASSGELVSNPDWVAASKIREFVVRMDDEYLRSALDYIEVHPDKEALVRGPHTFESPNLIITSIAQLPVYAADFGWGSPTCVRRGWFQADGACFMAPLATGGDLYMLLTLEAQHMKLFQTYFCQI